MKVNTVSSNLVTRQNNLNVSTKAEDLKVKVGVLNSLDNDVFECSSKSNNLTNGSAANVSFNGAFGFAVGLLTPIVALLYAMATGNKYTIK